MFDNIGPAELLTLALVGMFVLGPERLPEAARWVARTVATIKEYATGARDQLRNELGPDFDELRKPLEDLRSVRDLDPRRAVTRTLFDSPSAHPEPTPAGGYGAAIKPQSRAEPPLQPGEAVPFDEEAT